MAKPEKTLKKILDGSRNIRFNDMVRLLQAFGFALIRINGSYHIFQHPDVPVSANIQNANGQAKPY